MSRLTLRCAFLASCATLLTVPVLAIAGGAQSRAETAIKAENARWAEAYARGDDEAISSLYTDDGMLLPPGEERVAGRKAISAYFKNIRGKAAPGTVSFSHFEFYGNDLMMTEISNDEIRDHQGKLVARGKQTLVFLKQNGRWKLHRDMWSANGP